MSSLTKTKIEGEVIIMTTERIINRLKRLQSAIGDSQDWVFGDGLVDKSFIEGLQAAIDLLSVSYIGQAKVEYTGIAKARKYQHREIVITDRKLIGWDIGTSWGSRAPIVDITKATNGSKILISLRKPIK